MPASSLAALVGKGAATQVSASRTRSARFPSSQMPQESNGISHPPSLTLPIPPQTAVRVEGCTGLGLRPPAAPRRPAIC